MKFWLGKTGGLSRLSSKMIQRNWKSIILAGGVLGSLALAGCETTQVYSHQQVQAKPSAPASSVQVFTAKKSTPAGSRAAGSAGGVPGFSPDTFEPDGWIEMAVPDPDMIEAFGVPDPTVIE